MHDLFIRRGKSGHRYSRRTSNDGRGRGRSEAAVRQGMPRIGGHHPKLGRHKEGFSSACFRESMALLTP